MTPHPPHLDLDALTAVCTDPGDRSAAWRFATAFARDWSARPLGPGDGVDESELQTAEARLGLRLPAALREAYLLLGRRADLTSRHDVLLAPDALHLDDDRGVLVFRVENQACAYWGVRVADLDQDDPPVVARPDVATPIAEHWKPWLGRVSLEFTEILLSESMDGDDGHCDAVWDPGEEHFGILERSYQRLPLPAYPPAPDPGTRWYARADVLLRDDAAMIQVRGRTAAALEAARAVFPGAEWLDGSA
jgi:hypothetical protein